MFGILYSVAHIPSWYAQRQSYLSLYLLCYMLRSRSREILGWLRTISRILKFWKFPTDDIANVEVAEIIYVWYRRFWNFGNSLGEMLHMLKFWKFSREVIANVEVVEILYGRCRNGGNSVRKISQLLKSWTFPRDDTAGIEMVEMLCEIYSRFWNGGNSLRTISKRLKFWKFPSLVVF